MSPLGLKMLSRRGGPQWGHRIDTHR